MTCVNGRKLYDEQLSHVNGFWLKKKQNFLSIAVLRMKMEYPRGVRLSRLSPYSFWTSLRLNYGGRDQHDELHLPS